jgi:hypothetical protein
MEWCCLQCQGCTQGVKSRIPHASSWLLLNVGAPALLGVNETLLAQERESVLDRAIANVVTLHERPLGRQELPRLDLPRFDYATKDVR